MHRELKILTILGARPQFIKASAISRAIVEHNRVNPGNKINEIIVHSGQHFDAGMSDVFFDQLDIPKPDYHLGVSGLMHGAMTGRMLEKVEAVVQHEKPDWILVFGDTNTTLAGALAAVKLQIPVVHVEAGLRSNNSAMPEEINRVLTDRVSTILFCPTKAAVDNLKSEGYPFTLTGNRLQQIVNVGDVMLDVILHYSNFITNNISLSGWGVSENEYILCTLHRAENTNSAVRVKNILRALSWIGKELPVILPLHPRTRKMIDQTIEESLLKGVNVIGPIPYFEMQRLEMGARAILTDSGGMQKEAFFHGVPCITLRDETEWEETVELGGNVLAGADTESIIKSFEAIRPVNTDASHPFGYGDAAKKIIQHVMVQQ